MNVLAELVFADDPLGKVHGSWPVLGGLSDARQCLKQPQILLSVVTALILHPGLVTALHKLAAIEAQRAFIGFYTILKVSGAPGVFAFGHKPIEFLNVDSV